MHQEDEEDEWEEVEEEQGINPRYREFTPNNPWMPDDTYDTLETEVEEN